MEYWGVFERWHKQVIQQKRGRFHRKRGFPSFLANSRNTFEYSFLMSKNPPNTESEYLCFHLFVKALFFFSISHLFLFLFFVHFLSLFMSEKLPSSPFLFPIILLSLCLCVFLPFFFFPSLFLFVTSMHRSCLSCIIVALAFVLSSSCYQVDSVDDLISLFNNATGNTLQTDIEVTADLDFSSSTLTLPLGAFSNGKCVSFSGVFQGNGHSIKGLKMDNMNKAGYKHAGLFCSLKNAIVDNLVIDSSCSFTGSSAGALSVSVNGTLTVKNTTNYADVSGTERVGGFIGLFPSLEQGDALSFDKCVNNGNVYGSGKNIGGFIGFISGNMNMTISSSINTGNVTGGGKYVGGFVGYYSGSNLNANTTISSSINTGNVTGNEGAGGFFGFVGTGTFSMTECINNGTVGQNKNVGGFVGYVSGTNVITTISNTTNNGPVDGAACIGGFVGFISSSGTVSNGIVNSVNKAIVSAGSGMACGLFCVAPNSINVKSTILNSLNKGTVQTSGVAYGVATEVTKAKSVVSLGDVTGSSGSCSFWGTCDDKDLFFGLDGKCSNCGNAQVMNYNDEKQAYELVEGGEPVHVLLSDEAVKEKYGMMWSSELDVVFKPVVFVSGELNGFFVVDPGTALGDVKNLTKFFDNKNYGVVNGDNKTRTIYTPKHKVFVSINLIIGEWVSVSVGAPVGKNEKMVPGETLEQLSQTFGFVLDDFIIVNSNTGNVLSESWVVETSVSLSLCHHLTVSGVMSLSGHFEHGTPLAQIGNISQFLNSSFIIFNTSNPDMVFTNTTLLDRNIDATVSKVKRQEIIVVIDDRTNVTADDIFDVIMDLVVVPNDEHLWLDVVPDGDDSFRISVIQTDGVTDRVSDLLDECI